MTYLITFCLSTLLVYFGGECRGSLRTLLVSCGLLLPCILAGFRDVTVGTDTSAYALWTYNAASSMQLIPFMERYAAYSAPGYNLFTWALANISSFGFYLGAMEVFFVVPCYLAMKRFLRGGEWICMLAVYLLLYAGSLNLMKQSIAIAFVLLSAVYAWQRRFAAFVALVALGVSFHQTALVGFLLYPAMALLIQKPRRPKSSKWRGLIIGSTIGLLLAGVFVFGRQLVIAFSGLKSSYEYQVGHIGEGSINVSYLALAIFLVLAWWFCRDADDDSSDALLAGVASGVLLRSHALYDFFFGAAVVGCMLMQLDVVSLSLGRFGYYLGPFVSLSIARLYCCGDSSSRLVSAFFLLALSFFFMRTFVLLGGNQIYPYVTSWGLTLF